MLYFLLAAILAVLVCVALADDGVRYLLGQLMKMILGFGLAALCLAFIVVVLINAHH